MPLYFAYFDDWDVKRNYDFIKSKIDFKGHDNGRSQVPLQTMIA